MDQPSQQDRAGPRRLPIVCVGGNEYFVDQRLREFRTVTPPAGPIEFISFESECGRQLLRETVLIPCDLCGEPQLQPRRAIPSDVVCFDCIGRRLQ
jgi:hypothetical protein